MNERVTVIGGGLSGSEAALQLATRGIGVDLYEMRPVVKTAAHRTDRLAEVVCSNSFKSMSPSRPSGLLKEELERVGSFLIPIARTCRVEAGTALAIDRDLFAASVSERVEQEANITIHRREVREIPTRGPVILATGPLTSDALAASIQEFVGQKAMYFYDSTAPIVAAESIDRNFAFEANRRDLGDGHYLNCPFDERQYDAFFEAVLESEQFPLHEFEKATFFEACMPIDDLARRGRKTLLFGPMRPVGLVDPRTGGRPFAVVQLRPENREATSYNLVGFQNRMRHGDQTRVLRLIPGLENAEFYRLGRIHRNSYLDAPRVLDGFLRMRNDPRVALAGQLTGLEGYVEAVATGMLAGIFMAATLAGNTPRAFPRETALGALLHFVSSYPGPDYRPTNINLGLFPPVEGVRKKKERNEANADRARTILDSWFAEGGQEALAFPPQ